MMEIDGCWQENKLIFNLGADLGKLTIATNQLPSDPRLVTLYYADSNLVAVQTISENQQITRSVQIEVPETIETTYLTRFIMELAQNNGLKIETPETSVLPQNQHAIVQAYWENLAPILTTFGFAIKKTKKRTAKAQHRWNAKVAKVAFTTDYADTSATIYWRKRNEVVIHPGAKMKPQPDLNVNGELGFSARFATQLRQENDETFNDNFITTKEVVVKSINEVGLFLYFGNTNSWLQLKDQDGRTIDDWTVVK